MGNKFKILSLDGGGARGYITTLWLEEFERRLGKPLHEEFDLIIGTSTGSIIASGLASGLYASEMVELYRTFAHKIFESGPLRWWDKLARVFGSGLDSPKYSGENLEKVFRIAYGNLKFGHLKTPTIITSYNLRDSCPLIFKSWQENFSKVPTWELVKASSSAPIYFPAHILRHNDEVIPLIDGGVVANNPAMVALSEAYRILKERNGEVNFNDIIVASFGTGEKRNSIKAEKAEHWGLIGWINPIADILFDGAMDSVVYMADQYLGDNHYRFQTSLCHASDEMDDASDENMKNLSLDSKMYLENGGYELMDKLISNIY